LNYDDLRWLRARENSDFGVLTDKTGRPALGHNLDPAHVAMTFAMPEHISSENYNKNIAGRESLAFPSDLATGQPFVQSMAGYGGITGKAKWTDEEGGPLPPKPKGLRQKNFKWGSMKLPIQDPIYQGRKELPGFGIPRNGKKIKPKFRDMWATKFGVGNNLSKPRGLYLAGADTDFIPAFPPIPQLEYKQNREIEIGDLLQRIKEQGFDKKPKETKWGEDENLARIGNSTFQPRYAHQLYQMLKPRPKLDLATISTDTNFPLQVRTLGGENYDEAGDYRNKNILSHWVAPRVIVNPIEGADPDVAYKNYTDILEDI
jgi:hypothetical protein